MAPTDSRSMPTERTAADPDHQLPPADGGTGDGAGSRAGRRGGGRGSGTGRGTGAEIPLERSSSPPDLATSVAPEEHRRTGIGELVRDLADDTRVLVQQEIELAKMEVAASIKRVVRDSAWIGAGIAILAVGGLVLVVALALLLGALLDSYWLGTLIVAVLLLLVGAVAAWLGVRDLKKGGLMPKGSLESVKEDKAWAQREADDFKRGLKEERV